MSRRLPATLAAALAIGAVATGTADAATTPSPSPTNQTLWPEPGDRALPASPTDVTGRPLTVRVLRRPLILIDQDVEQTRGTSFTVGADVLFATGKATLSPAATEALAALTKKIQQSGVTGKASVVGHTDDVGGDADNLALSRDRASAVTQRLTGQLSGVTLTPVGMGEKEPLAPNTTDANRARNRRVSIVFLGATTTTPSTTDVARPASLPAPVAPAAGAPQGTLVGTTRTIVAGTDAVHYRLRLDVTRRMTVGDSMVMLEFTSQLLNPGNVSFSNAYSQFSGDLYDDDAYVPAVYDRSTDQKLPPVIDGQGVQLAGRDDNALTSGGARTTWMVFPLPRTGASAPLELYLPAYGVLTVPAAS